MQENNLKEEIERLKNIGGEALGIAVRSGFEYVLFKKGKEGVDKLEKELSELGFPIKHNEIRKMDFYPLWWEVAIFLVAKSVFGFTNKDFQELGEREAKLPLIVRLFMQYFGSINIIAREAPKLWRKYYTVGDFRVTDFDEQKKYAVIRIENLKLHPLHCQNIIGYLKGTVTMVGKQNVKSQEVKCVHRGDNYHEYLVQW